MLCLSFIRLGELSYSEMFLKDRGKGVDFVTLSLEWSALPIAMSNAFVSFPLSHMKPSIIPLPGHNLNNMLREQWLHIKGCIYLTPHV